MMKTSKKALAIAAVLGLGLGGAAIGANAMAAQTAGKAPAALVNDANEAQVQTLSLTALEQKAAAAGIKVKELKVQGLILKIEGYDSTGREMELLMDRRNGDILSRRPD